MLSKIDIQKELGTGICVYPLKLENIKENSMNLCAGKYAWSLDAGTVYCDENESDKNLRYSLVKDQKHKMEISISKCDDVIFEGKNNKRYIVLLPMTTTLIETDEVLAVGSYIGGTYHSKVGLVSKGIGHIGTMVGPNFSGESLIAFHNISKDLIVLEEGESFISVVFYYLKTPYSKLNPTISGHTDKFAALGIRLSQDASEELNADWKKQFDQVQRKMKHSDSYRELQSILKGYKKRHIKRIFNKKNIIIVAITICSFVLLYRGAVWLDTPAGNEIWTERFWNVGCSGIFVTVLSAVIRQIFINANSQ